MLASKGKILFISSADPLHGPGTIALDYVNALREGGYFVDFLTKDKVPFHPEIKFVLDKKNHSINNILYRIWLKLKRPCIDGHYLFYRRENRPPVQISTVLKSINEDYDYVVIFFWQELLSYKTVESIYDKLGGKAKFFYICADYSPMTGGCHFMGDCNNFEKGCGNCPILGGKNPNDFTHKNMIDRIRINAKIKPKAFMNQFMQSFFEKSPSINNHVEIHNFTIILDLDRFSPCNRDTLLNNFGISSDKFIIFFGCQSLSDERKGMKYLLESLKVFNSLLSSEERNRILVITAGRITADIISKIPFQQKHFGYVDINMLPKLYSMSNIFLSPSINDAGPSMVCQSIACGTPVIAFDMGVAKDNIKGHNTGVCVPMKDVKAFAEAVDYIFRLDKQAYNTMRHDCRKTAEHLHSTQAFLRVFENSIK